MGNDSTAVSIFNQLISQYDGSFNGIQQGSIAIAKELFWVLSLISVAVLGINRLLGKNVDMVESNLELIKLIIYLNVFYLFIDQFPNFLPLIIQSFKQAAFYMGGMIGQNTGNNGNVTTSFTVATNPGAIINVGLNIASNIFVVGLKKFNIWTFTGVTLMSVICGLAVIFCFGLIACKIVIIEISYHIIMYAGIFMLAFAALPWTREYAQRYIGSIFGLGVQLLFTYLIVGIGQGLTSTWMNTLQNVQPNQLLPALCAVLMATLVYYKICMTVPDQAASYLSGGMTLNSGVSNPGVIASAVGFVAGMKGLKAGMVDMKARVHGSNKAWAAANSTTKETLMGEKGRASGFDQFKGAMATLHGARSKMKQEQWDNKVVQTRGGQLAERIKGEHELKKTKQQGSGNKAPGGGLGMMG